MPAAVVAYVLLVPSYGVVSYVLLAGSVLLFWVLFVMRTKCGYDLGSRGCANPVNGKANGCYYHGDLKRDAIFAALGMRNLGQLIRVKWRDGSSPKGRTWGATSPPHPQVTPAERSERAQGGSASCPG